MLKKLRCWLLGHDWKRMSTKYMAWNDHPNTMHFLFQCRECKGLKEYETKVAYYKDDTENDPLEVE